MELGDLIEEAVSRDMASMVISNPRDNEHGD